MKVFEEYGEITKFKLLRGKAFIGYFDPGTAKEALEGTNESELDGRTIYVEYAGKPRER